MNTAAIAFSLYLAAFVALVVLQFFRAIRVRWLVHNLNELLIGERLSASLANQVRLLRMPLPSAPPDLAVRLVSERTLYRHLTCACFFLLAVVLAFPFVAHRIWPLS